MKEPVVFKNLEVYNSLIDIILSNSIKIDKSKSLYLSKSKSEKIVDRFLKEDEFSNYKLLEKLRKESKVKFRNFPFSYFDNNTKKIKIKYTGTIDDSFSLIHEFYHYVCDGCDLDTDRIFSEVIPLTEELRLCNSLKSDNIYSDAKRQINQNFSYSYYYAHLAKQELGLYKHILKHGKIKLNELDSKLYKYFTSERQEYVNPSIDSYGKYIFGYVLSSYIDQSLKDNTLSIDQYKYIRNNIENLSLQEISDLLYIDLQFDDGLIIKEDDLKTLRKTYSKEVEFYAK